MADDYQIIVRFNSNTQEIELYRDKLEILTKWQATDKKDWCEAVLFIGDVTLIDLMHSRNFPMNRGNFTRQIALESLKRDPKIFVKRILRAVKGKSCFDLTLNICFPEVREDGYYECEYEIEYKTKIITFSMIGVDALDALNSALKKINMDFNKIKSSELDDLVWLDIDEQDYGLMK